MKKWIALVAMVAALGMASPVQASSLLPGATVSPVPPGTETSTTVVATFNEDFTTTTSLHGNIQETVFRETGGTLDFDYQVKLYADASDSAERLSTSSYTGFTTDVSAAATASGFATGTISPTSADRSSNGKVVGFNFAGGILAPGTTSLVMIVRTNAISETTGTVSVIDSIAFSDAVNFFEPTGSPAPPTPEPASLVLLGGLSLGVGAMAFRRHRKVAPVVA